METHPVFLTQNISEARKKNGIVLDKARAFAATALDFVQKWRHVLVLVHIIAVTPIVLALTPPSAAPRLRNWNNNQVTGSMKD